MNYNAVQENFRHVTEKYDYKNDGHYDWDNLSDDMLSANTAKIWFGWKWWTKSSIKRNVKKVDKFPEVLFLDGIFGTNNKNMMLCNLYSLLVEDESGEGRVGANGFLANEYKKM